MKNISLNENKLFQFKDEVENYIEDEIKLHLNTPNEHVYVPPENIFKQKSKEINLCTIVNSLKEKILNLESKIAKMNHENELNKFEVNCLKNKNTSLQEDNK